jgi:ATP-dependent DNA helicase RecG
MIACTRTSVVDDARDDVLGAPPVTTLAALQSLIARGESETLEFKRSTAELRRAGETLCAFLNGEGGRVLIGVAPGGKIVGQQVADITLRDIAAMLGRFEPSARVEMDRIDVGDGRAVIVLEAPSAREYARSSSRGSRTGASARRPR